MTLDPVIALPAGDFFPFLRLILYHSKNLLAERNNGLNVTFTGKHNQSIVNLYCDEFCGLPCLIRFFCVILWFDFEFMQHYYVV